MNRSKIIALHQIAQDNLDILAGKPKPGWHPDFLSSDIGDRLLELGVEMDGGNAFCAFYGHPAFMDAGEFREACCRRGDDLDALCSGILSQWRFYAHWNNAGLPDNMREWFMVTLGHLAELTDGGQ